MPRPPRFDAPGSIHHIWSRGVEKRSIFFDDRDRWSLRDRLNEVMPDCGAGCAAWAFMANHVHLVVRTGPITISSVMSRLLTGHAADYNKRHGRSGYLFQGRFGSRLIADDADLVAIIRYVHRNPLEAGAVPDLTALGRYRWSGHGALLGRRPALAFEDVRCALRPFAENETEARTRLREWMALPDEDRETGRDEFVRLVGDVSRRFGVLGSDVLCGRNTPVVSAARAEICRRASADLAMRGSEIARRLGVTRNAVSLALRRAPARAT